MFAYSNSTEKKNFPIFWKKAGFDLENIDFNFECQCQQNFVLTHVLYTEQLKTAAIYKNQLKTICGATVLDYLMGISGICTLIQSYCY